MKPSVELAYYLGLPSGWPMSESGPKTEVAALRRDVCFTPESGHWTDIPGGPFCADCVEKLGVEADRDR